MIQNENPYDIAYRRATDPSLREEFWREQATFIEWATFPSKILDSSNPPFYRWFADGQLNISHNAVDRHLKELADSPALIWVSNMVNKEKTYTYSELHTNVCRMANLFQQQGVLKGDRIIIYMPMLAQAVFAALASARVGCIHSIVFGGFAAKELAGRMVDCTPKLIVTTNFGLEPNKVVDYTAILKEAITLSNSTAKVLLYERPEHTMQIPAPVEWTRFSIDTLPFKEVPCTMVNANHPLYILYTSGTTGAPKGIVRDQGGTAVALEWTMKHIMGIGKRDVYFSASDIGWVVGHSFGIYGPLLRGATTIIYEGKPTTPNPGAYWQIFEKYKVNGFYTSPTGLRAIRKEDKDGDWIRKYDISSLRGVSMAGERCDVPTYEWIHANLKVMINDNYWQTEAGWIISCNYMNLHTFKSKPGSATKPCPGFKVEVLDHENNQVAPKTLGKVCIKLPMPPSFMLTLYNNDKAFVEKYLQETPGYYTTGDAGYFDEDGFLNIMTRLDDIINTAGHRLSTASMEEVLIQGGRVVEAAVVAKIEELKGEVPVGFVVLKQGEEKSSQETIKKELVALIRKEIGPVASFQHVIIVDKLPKTRSGKILRNVLRKILEAEPYKVPSTIEDEGVLQKIEEAVKKYGHGLGEKRKLIYVSDVEVNLKEAEEAALETAHEKFEQEHPDEPRKLAKKQ